MRRTTEQRIEHVRRMLTDVTRDLRDARANEALADVAVLEQREEELYEELDRLIPRQRQPKVDS